MRDWSRRPTYVYRCFDAQDRLLYVGSSVEPETRVAGHCANAWWGAGVAYYTARRFHDHYRALAEERRAIYTERPACNIRCRWYAGDPRSHWTEDDYAALLRALDAGTVKGERTLRLIDQVTAEAAERFEVAS